jgi:hypothetical protein
MLGSLRRMLGASLALATTLGGCGLRDTASMLLSGDSIELRERPEGAPVRSSQHAPLLVLAIDGLDRDLLYEMLEQNELPELSRLIGGSAGGFAHAHFDRTTLSTLPSTTMAAWVTTFSGATPAEHGVTGNEFFVREKRQLVAPVPVSFDDLEPMLENYTDGYTNRAALRPSVFQRMRQRDPHVLIWVAMLPYHAGADLVLKPDRGAILDALKAFVQKQVSELKGDGPSYATYETLDEETTEAVVEQLEDRDEAVPDVLCVYYAGTDQYAHVSPDGPDRARREYLKNALEPELGRLRGALEARAALADRWVIVVSDHGHTEVKHDARHALGTDAATDPPAVLTRAGFRIRPFQREVADDHDFQAVLAYQGAIAFVYLADRSRCPRPGTSCDWKRPPRFREDVLAAADAFFRASRDGALVPELQGTLDLVLARLPRPQPEQDAAFEVYTGDGKLVPLGRYLARHPRPSYAAFEERLRDLAVGPAGERAGDVLLIANNGNRDRVEERYYFSAEYHSWHGSPSRADSELPLIVAHSRKSKREIERLTRRVLGREGRQQEIADLLLSLRYGPPAARRE